MKFDFEIWQIKDQGVGKKSYRSTAIFSLSALTLTSSLAAFAQSVISTDPVTIDFVASGWNADQVLVNTVEQPLLQTNCPLKDGYVTRSDDPARRLIHNLVITAHFTGKK